MISERELFFCLSADADYGTMEVCPADAIADGDSKEEEYTPQVSGTNTAHIVGSTWSDTRRMISLWH